MTCRYRVPGHETLEARPPAGSPASVGGYFSVYLHIPFCRRLCPYCHFYRVPEVVDWEVYLAAVLTELGDGRCRSLGRLRTVYAGGGTPTLMPPPFYRAFFRALEERFGLDHLAEATIESDGNVSPEDLASLADAGFDRISIGVKSFDPETRRILGAAAPGAADDLVGGARTAGFSSVGLDLVYGIDGQRMEDLQYDLERAVDLAPDHMSLYALEEGEAGGPQQADDDLTAAMFRESRRLLAAAGYRQYEISNFAVPGHESLHNSAYWRDADYIGLGPSAHSSVTARRVRFRRRNLPDVEAYLRDPAGCGEDLSREEGVGRAREALILGLRMASGVDRAQFAGRYGVAPGDLVKPYLHEMTASGLIRMSSRRIRLTARGMLLSNEVFTRLL